jgi:predicted dehydrogenase
MVHVHPQWLRTLEIVRSGEIGALRAMNCVFGYNNRDPRNIRNLPEAGGGALMDIGCYPIHTARWIFGEEPWRVCGLIERDPAFDTDRLISGLLDFPSGQAAFTCSTQLAPYQRMTFFGDGGRVEIEIPVNAPPDAETRIFAQTAAGPRTETFGVCNQYTLQGDAFSRAIAGAAEVPVPLEDALANMAVIGALFRSADSGGREIVAP